MQSATIQKITGKEKKNEGINKNNSQLNGCEANRYLPCPGDNTGVYITKVRI